MLIIILFISCSLWGRKGTNFAERTRFKFRHCFIHSATKLKYPPHEARLQKWKNESKSDDPIQLSQYLLFGKDLQ